MQLCILLMGSYTNLPTLEHLYSNYRPVNILSHIQENLQSNQTDLYFPIMSLFLSSVALIISMYSSVTLSIIYSNLSFPPISLHGDTNETLLSKLRSVSVTMFWKLSASQSFTSFVKHVPLLKF